MRVQGSTHGGGDLRASLHDVGAVRRGRGVNSAIGLVRIERNELDGNGGCHDRAFVAEDVHVTVAGIDERRRGLSGDRGVHMALAVATLILRQGSGRDDDQAVARVRVPAGAPARLPDIALHVQV